MRSIVVLTAVLFVALFTGGSALADFTTSGTLAYIDPGTGSVIFGAIGYIIAGSAAALAFAIKPFRMLYRKYFKKPNDDLPEKDKAAKKP
jgi:hypothetical protein